MGYQDRIDEYLDLVRKRFRWRARVPLLELTVRQVFGNRGSLKEVRNVPSLEWYSPGLG
jgi:hypothetical protein